METDHELSNIVLLSLVDILKIENWGKILETGNLEIEFLSYIADTVDLGPSSVTLCPYYFQFTLVYVDLVHSRYIICINRRFHLWE